MKQLFIFVLCFLFLQRSNSHPYQVSFTSLTYISYSYLPVSEPIVNKKPSFKEKLLVRLYKLKTHQQPGKEQKAANLTGYLSLIASIASPLLLILNFGIASIGLIQVISIFALLLLPTSIILGIISLRKRKKLADKSGTSSIPALIGIGISSALLLLFLITLMSWPANGF